MCIQACPKVVTSHLCETSVAAGEASWPASTHCFNTFSLSEGRWSFSNCTTGDKKSQAQQWQLWEQEAQEWPQKITKGARGSFQKGGDAGTMVVCGLELPNPSQRPDRWPLGAPSFSQTPLHYAGHRMSLICLNKWKLSALFSKHYSVNC